MKYSRKFSFFSMNLPANTFKVVRFSGEEALSRPYFFDILLVSETPGLFIDDLADGNARLTYLYRNMRLNYQGLVFNFEQLPEVNHLYYYKALLAPRLWALSMTKHSQIFLDKTTPEIIEAMLLGSDLLTSLDVEFRLSTDYPKREYVCQYNESHFDFISRWCEREGIYYFFEQIDEGEKLVFTDNLISHDQQPRQPVLRFRQVTGLDVPLQGQVCTNFSCKQRLVPHSVQLRDYNYRHPTLNLDSGDVSVDQGGLGKIYVYGENFKTLEEGKHIAKVRAEQMKAEQTIFKGEGRAPFIRSGFLFTLEDHPVQDLNADYLTTSVTHEGDQTSYLVSGLSIPLDETRDKPDYHISFRAIPAGIQYRPARTTFWPRLHGTMHAKVEAEGSGKYAFLDEQGRYKVRLPFDLADHPEGKASCWLRMAQPYGGSNHGMHFPLHKGTEVLLTFIDGDLDRPIIAAALPNFEQQSLVKSGNSSANAIRSAAGNQLVMGDTEGQEFIGLFSPHAQSGIAIGSHKPGGGGSIAVSTHGVFEECALGGRIGAVAGSNIDLVVGFSSEVTAGVSSEVKAAICTEAALLSKVSYTKGKQIELGDEAMDLKKSIALTGLDRVELSGGIGDAVNALVSKAKKALYTGIAASIAGGVGIAMISRPFDKKFLEEAKCEWHGAPSWVGGGVSTVIGIALAAYSAYCIKSVASSFDKTAKNAKTGTITLDRTGVAIKVNSKVNQDAKLKMEVDENGIDSTKKQKSSISITEKGNSILFKNRGTAYLGLEEGDSISAYVQHKNKKMAGLMLSSEDATMLVNGCGQLAVDTDGVTLLGLEEDDEEVTPGGIFMAKGDEALIMYGDNKRVSIKSNLSQVSGQNTTVKAQTTLTLDGQTINIG